MEETLEEKLNRAWSTTDEQKIYRSRYIGMVVRGTRVLKVFEDKEGDCWYKTYHIDTETGELLNGEEYLFGKNRK